MAKEKDPNKPIMVARAAYLGGLPGDAGSEKLFLPLLVSPTGIGHNVGKKRDRMTNWSDVRGVSFESGTAAKSRVGKAVMFGVFALAAKKTQDDAHLTVFRRDGNVAIFHVVGMSGLALRAKVQPFLTAAGVACLDDQPNEAEPAVAQVDSIPAPSPTLAVASIADELAKLASLNQSGILTDDEFAQQKANLLGS